MKMFKNFLALSIIAGLLFGMSVTLNAQADKKDGKTIFVDAKCTNCHSVESKAIEAKKKSDKTVDLSKVGAANNADFLKKYMKKEEAIKDKKHPIAFKGEETDFDTLINWLLTLK